MTVGNDTISNTKYEMLLEIKIDCELKFIGHAIKICNKLVQK